MREEQGLPVDRGNAARGETAANRDDESSVPPADGAAPDVRSDTPAPLSAVSHPADAEEFGLTDEDIATYRRRVADGLYNTREVADEVARRMLKRGDI